MVIVTFEYFFRQIVQLFYNVNKKVLKINGKCSEI